EARHIQRVAPIDPRLTLSRRSAVVLSTMGLLDRPRHHEREPGALCAQQPLEPQLIEQHLLVRRLPEGPNLLFLAPGWKDLLLDGESQQRFEMGGLGVRVTSLPSADRFSGDAQQFG